MNVSLIPQMLRQQRGRMILCFAALFLLDAFSLVNIRNPSISIFKFARFFPTVVSNATGRMPKVARPICVWTFQKVRWRPATKSPAPAPLSRTNPAKAKSCDASFLPIPTNKCRHPSRAWSSRRSNANSFGDGSSRARSISRTGR